MSEKLRNEWKKYKRNDLVLPLRIIDFVWRKKYKQALFLISLVGIILIVFSDYIVERFFSIQNITAPEKLLGVIYFLTAVIIFWYTRETYDLKVLQRKELEEIRKQTNYEMRPYLRLQWYGNEADLEKYEKIIQIVNDGRGIARDITFERVTFTGNALSFSFLFKKRPVISSGGVSTISADELFDTWQGMSIAKNDFNLKGFLEKRLKENFVIKGTYRDIENRIYTMSFQSDLEYNDKFRIVTQDLNSI